jgi:hypothetical protein
MPAMSAAEQPRSCPLGCLPPDGFGFDHHAATPTLAFALRLAVLYGSVGKSAMPRARAEIFYYAIHFATLIAVCITVHTSVALVAASNMCLAGDLRQAENG